jgi:hypothetical protein
VERWRGEDEERRGVQSNMAACEATALSGSCAGQVCLERKRRVTTREKVIVDPD